MNLVLLGALAMAAAIISLFFLRFWRDTRDRFFLFFALAFLAEGSTRILLTWTHDHDEYEPYIYFIRLLAYTLILMAIIDKNRRGDKKN